MHQCKKKEKYNFTKRCSFEMLNHLLIEGTFNLFKGTFNPFIYNHLLIKGTFNAFIYDLEFSVDEVLLHGRLSTLENSVGRKFARNGRSSSERSLPFPCLIE